MYIHDFMGTFSLLAFHLYPTKIFFLTLLPNSQSAVFDFHISIKYHYALFFDVPLHVRLTAWYQRFLPLPAADSLPFWWKTTQNVLREMVCAWRKMKVDDMQNQTSSVCVSRNKLNSSFAPGLTYTIKTADTSFICRVIPSCTPAYQYESHWHF